MSIWQSLCLCMQKISTMWTTNYISSVKFIEAKPQIVRKIWMWKENTFKSVMKRMHLNYERKSEEEKLNIMKHTHGYIPFGPFTKQVDKKNRLANKCLG